MNDLVIKNKFIEQNKNLFTKDQLDWWIRKRESNGLEESGAIVKKFNRWWINPQKFAECMQQGDQ